MESRVQFRIDEETKALAQKAIGRKGSTLSDACRKLTEQLAEEQKKFEQQDDWITEQVNMAFERLDNGEAKFLSHDDAEDVMEARKAVIRKIRS